jgi:LSD1 subclass zinc finger protein
MTSPDTLRVMCPNLTCRKILAVPTSARGKTVRCRSCQTNIRIPGLPSKEAGEKKPESASGTGTAAA